MKKLLFLILLLPTLVKGQNEHVTLYNRADSLIQYGQIDSGYVLLKNLETEVMLSDTLYPYVLWYLSGLVSHLERENLMNEDFDKALPYALENLELVKKGTPIFDLNFKNRKYFGIKNVIVNYFGLKNYEKVNEYKAMLYDLQAKGELPEGIDQFFNFDYFRIGDKNIWGYEWYAELPEDRFSTSFSKVVYYVYSTNPDGSDKDQLYRLHILMFHGDNPNLDYVMDKRLDTATEEFSGTLYQYNYKEDIDYEKLHNDVIEIVNTSKQPDTQRVIKKKKKKRKKG
ncbi:MAG: hypothetical protein AAF740_12310 [Bacteroidota bacterium]